MTCGKEGNQEKVKPPELAL